MHDLGMNPMECIKSATIVNAQILEAYDKIGSIDPGKWADIIAVPGDPFTDFSVMQKVNFVMKDGKIYKQ